MPKAALVVNEEGKGVLPRNEKATLLFYIGRAGCVLPGDYIAGPAVFCDLGMLD